MLFLLPEFLTTDVSWKSDIIFNFLPSEELIFPFLWLHRHSWINLMSHKAKNKLTNEYLKV